MTGSVVSLGRLGKTYGGLTGKSKADFGTGDAHYVTFMDVVGHVRLTGDSLERVQVARSERQNGVRRGDLLFNGSSETPDEVALSAVVDCELPRATYLNSFCFGYRLDVFDEILAEYLAYYFRSSAGRALVSALAQGAIRYNISKTKLMKLEFGIPIREELVRTVEALRAIDGLISSLASLVAKKEAMQEGLMQRLLNGKTRLPGFEREWRDTAIADLFSPRAEVNTNGDEFEVLTCTKHRGFVRSLDYFNSQVFSRDLTGYRVVRHGDLAYPANHVEEGSIGVQELADIALVSPIYVVLKPRPNIDSYFMFKLLKQDSYRQRFAHATSASVDRRGSLRWPEFSRIRVVVPEIDEQRQISRVLRDAEAEIVVLKERLHKATLVKHGMMQKLLSGGGVLVSLGVSA